MAKALIRTGQGSRSSQASKYDAQNTVLSKTYGALADLRRELADSPAAVTEREELLRGFATCGDSQRAWLLLEDYFEKLSLSRKDFPGTDWWPQLLAAQGRARLEEVAFLFLRAQRSVPTELGAYASLDRFAQVSRRPGNSSMSGDWRRGSFRPSRRTLMGRAPFCERFAGPSPMRNTQAATVWPCGFICSGRARVRRSGL